MVYTILRTEDVDDHQENPTESYGQADQKRAAPLRDEPLDDHHRPGWCHY